MKIAVIFFAFNRPDKFKCTINSYLGCKLSQRSDLFVFIDGARNLDDSIRVDENYRVAKQLLPEATILRRSYNYGLKRSIFEGVTNVLDSYDAVVVLEDDLILSDNFYTYMKTALLKYKDNHDVFQISGFSYVDNNDLSCSFLPLTTSWGWATWAKKWNKFDISIDDWAFINNKNNIFEFDCLGTFNFSKMLKKEYSKQVSSWAIRWYHYVFQNKGLVLYPPVTLVKNAGFGDDATHSSHTAKILFSNEQPLANVQFIYPDNISINYCLYNKMCSYFKKSRRIIFVRKIMSYLGVKYA